MTDIWYDTEFREDGRTIELISIGMVREDGQKLYLINSEVDRVLLVRHEWLYKNVVRFLPMKFSSWGDRNILAWDEDHPDFMRVQSRAMIRDAVRRFVLGVPDPQLWAWYGAYDHVVLAQLFGRMIDLPSGFPMWTNDVRQLSEECGNPMLPAQDEAQAHNALADAEWTREAYRHLRRIERQALGGD